MPPTGEKLIDAGSAVSMVHEGHTVLVGGFGLSGTPFTLIDALADRSEPRDLTTVSNNCGYPNVGLGRLLNQGRIRRAVGSFFSANPDVARLKEGGQLDVTLLPQGTLAEALRAGGAGIAAFYTPTGVGTDLSIGKETREFDGRTYVLERAIRGDVALIKGHRADTYGNLTYRMTARSFNPLMATAADLVIAEVDQIVPVGELDPEEIVTPHLFVDWLVLSAPRAKAERGGAHR